MKRIVSLTLVLLLLAGAGFAVVFFYYPELLPGCEYLAEGSSFSVTFLDVGQGDAALVECDGHYILIDGGSSDRSQLIYSVLTARGIDFLDLLIGSHPHEDHVGGLSAALRVADADTVLCSARTYEGKSFFRFTI